MKELILNAVRLGCIGFIICFLAKNKRKDLRILDRQALRYNAQKLRKSEFKAKIAAFCYY